MVYKNHPKSTVSHSSLRMQYFEHQDIGTARTGVRGLLLPGKCLRVCELWGLGGNSVIIMFMGHWDSSEGQGACPQGWHSDFRNLVGERQNQPLDIDPLSTKRNGMCTPFQVRKCVNIYERRIMLVIAAITTLTFTLKNPVIFVILIHLYCVCVFARAHMHACVSTCGHAYAGQ